jgi:hypothetical protein
LHGIKGVKSELFAIRASFADDTQSCRKLQNRGRRALPEARTHPFSLAVACSGLSPIDNQ